MVLDEDMQRVVGEQRLGYVASVRVEQVAPVVSPAYDDGTGEQEVEARSLARYGLARTKNL